MSRGDLDGALVAVRRAADLETGNRELSSNLAQLLLSAARRATIRGDRGAASAFMSEAVARDPSLRGTTPSIATPAAPARRCSPREPRTPA